MKKTYVIFFEANGLGDTKTLHPISECEFETKELAEIGIQHILYSIPDKKLYILTRYSSK